jgi:hypothetical protein
MHAVIKVEGVKATFDGRRWTSLDEKLAETLNASRWRGSRHSEHGFYGSHVMALAEDLGAEVVSVVDVPTDETDVS